MAESGEHLAISPVKMLEAVLFAAGNTMTTAQIGKILQVDAETVAELTAELQQSYIDSCSGLTLRQVAAGYQLATRPEAFATLERLSQVVDRKISAPTMETLSIIAFKQPITKPEVEHIRGVRVERALQKLLELDLITEVGRKKVIGRPILYGTTDTFLRSFGINDLSELPLLPSTEEAVQGLNPEQLELFEEVQKLQSARIASADKNLTDENIVAADNKD